MGGEHGRVVVLAFIRGASIFLSRLLENLPTDHSYVRF
jgi:hypoxanthine-guanine phosphoribosyltransferase